jgi:hypothetical protein
MFTFNKMIKNMKENRKRIPKNKMKMEKKTKKFKGQMEKKEKNNFASLISLNLIFFLLVLFVNR